MRKWPAAPLPHAMLPDLVCGIHLTTVPEEKERVHVSPASAPTRRGGPVGSPSALLHHARLGTACLVEGDWPLQPRMAPRSITSNHTATSDGVQPLQEEWDGGRKSETGAAEAE